MHLVADSIPLINLTTGICVGVTAKFSPFCKTLSSGSVKFLSNLLITQPIHFFYNQDHPSSYFEKKIIEGNIFMKHFMLHIQQIEAGDDRFLTSFGDALN